MQRRPVPVETARRQGPPATPPWAAWDDGHDRMVVEGAAITWTASGPTCLQDLQSALHRTWTDWPVLAALPVFCGVAFTPDTDDPLFPDAWALLPRRLTRIRGDEAEVLEVLDVPDAARKTTCPPDPLPHPLPASPPDEGLDLDGWRGAVAAALDRIAAGDLEKVVLSRRRRALPMDPRDAWARLPADGPETARFAFCPAPGHAVVGASPERLVHLERGVLRTHALAGSTPCTRDEDAEAAADRLLHSDKDLREHRLVVQHVHDRLTRLGATITREGPLRVLRLPTVQHLETPFEAHTDRPVLDVVAALHPTPAVAGSPLEAALGAIRDLEPVPRGWFGGAVGWLDAQGDGRFHVALRMAHCTPRATWLHAGAGIVTGSDPDAEWVETEAKMAALDALLAEAA